VEVDDESFDVVHSKDSLHHMRSPERALAEYRRVLKPDGAALIVEANRYNPSFYLQMTLARKHQHFTRRRFRSLVAREFSEARVGAFEAHYVPAPLDCSRSRIGSRMRSSGYGSSALCSPTASPSLCRSRNGRRA
jgi:SAM-dependent methyltransferase